ncbi:Eukaryotic translation initiation factor 3 subunit J [Labeo rohita]|uniref:Eukaryotic translation initiation factor 3 subunit J n=1 Tax=Labeo rohita TaxID=84645 RepID=A0ABQ8LBW8_LABRO|nr:Eukaryotic translation initiation factor 3 subunit J [Labeo rohita]
MGYQGYVCKMSVFVQCVELHALIPLSDSDIMADADSWDADSFEPEEPIKKAAAHDKWEGEDEDDDVKDNWDDDEEEEKEEEKMSEAKPTEKKKLSEKIKEKENLQRKKQEELKKQIEESKDSTELTPEEELAEKLRVKKLQEDSDLELAKEAFVEVDDLKKISNSLTVLLSEKQRQEKANKGKKKKKGVLPGGGLKATMKDDLADYGHFDGGYAQDYEDFIQAHYQNHARKLNAIPRNAHSPFKEVYAENLRHFSLSGLISRWIRFD